MMDKTLLELLGMKAQLNPLPKDIAISFDGMPGPALGCLMVDRDLKLLWHRPFIANWPSSAADIRHCYEILHKKEPCKTCAALNAFASGRPASCEQVIVSKNGGRVHYHVVASPVRDDSGRVSACVEIIQDVSSRVKASETYKEVSEFNYNILFNAPVAIFTLNRSGIITSTNPAHLKIAGDPPLDKLMGMNWLDSPNVIKSGLNHYLEKGLEGESFEVVDFPYTAYLTKRPLFMTLKGVPLRNKQGEIEGLLCILEDTTEKTRYLRELEKLQQYNQNIIESITNGLMVIDLDRHVLTWNNGMSTIFQVSSAEAIGLALDPCLKRMGLLNIKEHIRKSLENGETFNLEKVALRSPVRGFLSLNLKLMPLFDENQQRAGVILFFEDITQKRKIEIQYQVLFDGAKDGIAVTETSGRFLSTNTKALIFFQTRWSDLQHQHIQDLVHPGDQERFSANLAAIREGKQTQPFEIRLAGRTREPVPVELSVSRVLVDREIIALQFIMRDIRERLRLEKQLLQASKLSGLGELAAGVAHEINNPLATIAGCAEEVLDLLEEWAPSMQPEQLQDLQELVRIMRDQSYRCKDITQNLLDFARVNAPSLLEVDLNEILRSVLALAGFPAQYGKGRVAFEPAPDLPSIQADYSQVQQVFLNILKNALDATEESGTILIRTKVRNGFVSTIFKDTGIGMTKEEQERMFDPFFTTKPPDKGTGLGLAICYRIVERLGGEIEVVSRKGAGTIFKVNLPMK